jgi:hypothetical protein
MQQQQQQLEYSPTISASIAHCKANAATHLNRLCMHHYRLFLYKLRLVGVVDDGNQPAAEASKQGPQLHVCRLGGYVKEAAKV